MITLRHTLFPFPSTKSYSGSFGNWGAGHKEAEITIQTFYRWRKEYGGLKMDQAKRMKELEKENGKLKRLVAELALDKQILKDIAEGNL